MEPTWTKPISSPVICDQFYALFVVNAILFVVGIIGFASIFLGSSLPKGVFGAQLFTAIFQLTLSLITSLFLQLICDRSLLARS